MDIRSSSSGKMKLFTFIFASGLLTISLSMLFSSCGITLFSSSCSGINVTCRVGSPTVLSPNATAQAQAVATMEAIKRNKPLLSDSLRSQNRNNWGNDSICSFHDGAYFLTVSNFSGTDSCDSSGGGGRWGNVAIQIDVTLYSYQSSAGLLFRATADQNEFYAFLINGAQFSLGLFGRDDTLTNIIPYTGSKAIHGQGKKNTLLVIAQSDDFRLFVNGTFVAEGYDSTLATGFVGLALSHLSSANARFSNLIVYPA